MACPRCQCNEISASGMCLWCGYQVNPPAPESKPGSQKSSEFSESTAVDSLHTPDEPAREELPQWRQELSNRLQSIKKKRETSQAFSKQMSETPPVANLSPAAPAELEKPADKSDPVLRPRPSARGSRRRTSPNRDLQVEVSAETEQKEFPEPVQPASDSAMDPVQEKDAREIIDAVLSRQPAQPEAPANGPVYPFQTLEKPVSEESRRILVHRLLSGLLDLGIMVICTAALIAAAGFFSGVRVLTPRSLIHCSVLFLLVYFIYSLLFLGFSNQTIGMMMMNLQVLCPDRNRPRLGRILARSGCFLLSLLCLGIGLIWALFDRDHQCLHDRLTNTRLTRARLP
jgi:uncharacterized RDD family membrane protein YckC